MARTLTVDADAIAEAIDEIATVHPMFRSQEELEQYMSAIDKIAAQIGITVPWGKGGPA